VISGTGAFRNATGSGRFQGNGRFIGERGLDGCSEDEDSGFFFFLVNVTGNISLSSASAA
nr:hypothetical protein [Actinomycetota bacterium]